jgi:hypothetical protein
MTTINQKRKKKLAMKISLTINWFFTDLFGAIQIIYIYIFHVYGNSWQFWAFVEKLIITFQLLNTELISIFFFPVSIGWTGIITCTQWLFSCHFLVLSTQWTISSFSAAVIGLFTYHVLVPDSMLFPAQKEGSRDNNRRIRIVRGALCPSRESPAHAEGSTGELFAQAREPLSHAPAQRWRQG